MYSAMAGVTIMKFDDGWSYWILSIRSPQRRAVAVCGRSNPSLVRVSSDPDLLRIQLVQDRHEPAVGRVVAAVPWLTSLGHGADQLRVDGPGLSQAEAGQELGDVLASLLR